MTHHIVKSWPEHFSAVVSGEKKAELRKNDRNYKAGDTITFQEWAPAPHERYTERQHHTKITHVIDCNAGSRDPNILAGLAQGWCILSIG